MMKTTNNLDRSLTRLEQAIECLKRIYNRDNLGRFASGGGGVGGMAADTGGNTSGGGAGGTGGKFIPSKEQKKALKSMPTGTRYREGSRVATWSKRGGYAGEKAINSTQAKLSKLGYKHETSNPSNSPTGSVVGSSGVMKHKDGSQLEWSVSYGEIAMRNSYSMRLHLGENPSRDE